MKVKDIMILDLSKRSHNLAAQLKECTKLYELVKVLTLLALLVLVKMLTLLALLVQK
jgi:hypothetical protein